MGNIGEADQDNMVDVDVIGWTRRMFNWAWLRTSPSALQNAETSILKHIGVGAYNTNYVNIGNILNQSDIHVWTFSSNESLNGIPVVLLHGLGSGLALWAINLKELLESKTRPVYALDIPGFGRSSRPNYSSIPEEAEEQLVQVIEAWRSVMGIENFVLVGHSFGGYISFAYSLRHPHRIAHLILADPWGFKNPPVGLLDVAHIPIHHRFIASFLNLLPLNPFWTLRLAGPIGPQVLQKIRADLIKDYSEFMDDADTKIANYIYHCNVRNATGESAFYALMTMFGWARNPIEARIEDLDTNIPLTLVYGARSWVDHYPAAEVVRRRPNASVNYHMLDANHHVYADQPDPFNEIVLEACLRCDNLRTM